MTRRRKQTSYIPKKTILEFPTEKRTISKYFDDDEIIGRTADGDLILHMGVKRKAFNKDELSLEMEEVDSLFNYELMQADEWRKLVNRAKDSGEYTENDIIEPTLDMEDRLTN